MLKPKTKTVKFQGGFAWVPVLPPKVMQNRGPGGQTHPVLLHGKSPTLLLCEEPPAVRVERSKAADYQWYELCKKCLGNRWILLIGWCQRGILLKLSIIWFLLLWTNKHMFSVASAFTDMAANVGFIWKCQEIMEEGAAPDWHPIQ